MISFLKKHIGQDMLLTLDGNKTVSGHIQAAGEGAVMLKTPRNEMAIRPDNIMMAETVAQYKNTTSIAPEYTSGQKIIVPHINRPDATGQTVF